MSFSRQDEDTNAFLYYNAFFLSFAGDELNLTEQYGTFHFLQTALTPLNKNNWSIIDLF